MEDLFGINAHRQAVQENIEKAFDLGFDADNNIEGIEKAKHNVGDIHPNGRWVWTEYAPGKFDWKSLKGKHHKGSQQTTTQQQTTDDKEVASFMDKVKIFSSKYNDPSKISVSKTPRGSWNVRYDGHRLGIFNASTLSEETANKQGWNEDSGEKFKQRWKNEHKDLSDETIQSYADNSRDIKYKQDVVDAAKELLEERKKKKQEEKKERYLLKPDGTPIDLSKESDENLSFTRSVIMQNIKRFRDDLEHAGKNAHVTRSKLIISISKQEGMLKEVEEEIEKRKKDKQTTTKSTSSKGVDEYINKMADDSKWAALVEVMADVDLSDYETEDEAREAIRSKVSLKKLESAWKKFNKQ